MSQADLVPMEYGGRVVSPIHFLYAYDILVFGRASKRNLKVIVDASNDYDRFSGQQASWKNSYIYFGPHTPSARYKLLALFSWVIFL